MADPINLRQFKKHKERLDKEEKAAQNRQLHGRTLAEKSFAKRQKDKNIHFLDHNKLDHSDDE